MWSAARLLAERIQASEEFRLLSSANFNVVCFALKTNEAEAVATEINDFLARLIKDDKVFMTPTFLSEKKSESSAALCNWRTTEDDIEIAWGAMQRWPRQRLE